MSEIRKIKRKELDLEKYSKTLSASLNYRVYAEYWYLDVLTNEKWECLVYGDYEVVMPIPLQYKFGIKFVLQPIYCQQLGVFYKEEISDELFRRFEQKLHQYRVRSYCFNEENTEGYHPQGEKRVNYVLNLNRPYEEIFANFRKDRKRNIKKIEKLNFSVEDQIDFESFYTIFKNNYSDLFTLIKDTKKLFIELNKRKALLQYSIKFYEEINNQRMFILSKNRIIIIASGRNKNSKIDFSSYLIDTVIQKYVGKEIFLDFEGSMNPNISHFMEGFGAEKKYYIRFSNFKLNFRAFKQRFKNPLNLITL